jgi:hypothetical protein
MNAEPPSIVRRVFARLCKGDNLILSRNGSGEDADLFRQLEAEEQSCKDYFAHLGFRLERGDNFYFFAAEDEPRVNLDGKLDRLIWLVRLLDFLSTHIENFGEGVIFSAATLAARCNGDARAERFLHETAKGSIYLERLEYLLQFLLSHGYLSEFDASRQEYRVLSAINYLFDFADRIVIEQDGLDTQEHDVET